MFGHRYFGASYFGPRYFGPASAAVVVVTVEAVTARKRPGPSPGSYPPKRFYLPPGEKLPSVTLTKRIYSAARTKVPKREQQGLIPSDVRRAGTSTAVLPKPQFIDFGKLRNDLETLRALIGAIERAEAAKAHKRKRRREEEFVAQWFIAMLDGRKRDEEVLVQFLMVQS